MTYITTPQPLNQPLDASAPQAPKRQLSLALLTAVAVSILLAIGVALYLFVVIPSQQTELQPTTPRQISVTGTLVLDSPSELPELPLTAGPPITELKVVSNEPAGAELPTSSFPLNKPSKALITLHSTESSQEIDGVELVLKYDRTLLQNVRLQPSGVFKTVVRNKIDTENGIISLTMIRQSSESISAGEGITLATISFTPVQSGEAVFTFDPTETLVAGNGGNNILEQTHDLRISVE
jgi:hypothetical protein